MALDQSFSTRSRFAPAQVHLAISREILVVTTGDSAIDI